MGFKSHFEYASVVGFRSNCSLFTNGFLLATRLILLEGIYELNEDILICLSELLKSTAMLRIEIR